MQAKLALVIVLVLPMLLALEMGLRRTKRARAGNNRSAIELLTGLQAPARPPPPPLHRPLFLRA